MVTHALRIFFGAFADVSFIEVPILDSYPHSNCLICGEGPDCLKRRSDGWLAIDIRLYTDAQITHYSTGP